MADRSYSRPHAFGEWGARRDEPSIARRAAVEDARLSQAELGRRVGLSAPAVAERLGAARARRRDRRLPRRGRARARSATRSPRSCACGPRRARSRRSPTSRAATPEVVECHRVTGEDCFYMKLHVRSVEHLEEVIDRFTPYGQTTTSIIQSSPVARRGLELGADCEPRSRGPASCGGCRSSRRPGYSTRFVAAAREHDPGPAGTRRGRSGRRAPATITIISSIASATTLKSRARGRSRRRRAKIASRIAPKMPRSSPPTSGRSGPMSGRRRGRALRSAAASGGRASTCVRRGL